MEREVKLDVSLPESGNLQRWVKVVMAVSFSGGRDSLVVLHMALRKNPDIPVVYVDTTLTLPECNEYVEWLADEWGLNLVKASRLDFYHGEDFWYWVHRKRFFPRMDCRWCLKLFKIDVLKILTQLHGIDSMMLGVKLSDNSRRKMWETFSRIDPSLGVDRELPILKWSDSQVKAYIKKNKLPVNPCYRIYGHSGNCYYCPFIRNPKHYLILKRRHPQLFDKIVEAEEKLGKPSLWGNGKPIWITKLKEQEFLGGRQP